MVRKSSMIDCDQLFTISLLQHSEAIRAVIMQDINLLQLMIYIGDDNQSARSDRKSIDV
jgi:hypothetical protein